MNTRVLSAGAAFAAILSAAALAKEPPRSAVEINQEQLAATFGTMGLQVQDVGAASAAAIAVANTATAAVDTPLSLQSAQRALQPVGAAASIQANNLGEAAAAANATGNGLVAHGTGQSTVTASQVKTAGTNVTASSRVAAFTGGAASAASVASANAAEISASNGAMQSFIDQQARANVETDATVLFGSIGSASAGAVSAGNSLKVGANGAAIDQGFSQSNGDPTGQTVPAVSATASAAADDATDLVSSASAAGNTIDAASAFGDVTLTGYQGSQTTIDAVATTAVGNWNGVAAATSYGVGNSLSGAVQGARAAVNVDQFSVGPVNSFATLTGVGGGVGAANASAYGNSVALGVCIECGEGSASGRIQQQTRAAINAVATINVGGAEALQGSAVAIGNAATLTAGRKY